MVGNEWQRRQGSAEVRLMEEAMEVAKAALDLGHATSKAERFGMDDHHPKLAKTNRELVAEEMADLVRHWNELAEREGLPTYAARNPQEARE